MNNKKRKITFVFKGAEDESEEEEDVDTGQQRKRSRTISNEERLSAEFENLVLSDLTRNSKYSVPYFENLTYRKMKPLLKEQKKLSRDDTFKPLRIRVLESDIPEHVKRLALDKVSVIERNILNGMGADSKSMNWLDTVLSLPFSKTKDSGLDFQKNKKKIKKMMKSFYDILDEEIYGQKRAKTALMSAVSQMIINPDGASNRIALKGSAGCGKTSLLLSLSKAFNRDIHFISLAGATDASEIYGHGYTYESAKPGMIVEFLKKSGYNNPIIFFDELDKASETPKGKEIVDLLLQMTDPIQNHKFRDKFVGNVDIDLSKILFVFSYNEDKGVSQYLRSRINIIEMEDYTFFDKLIIARDFMIPKILKEFKFKPEDIEFDEDSLKNILCNYVKKEKGVREMRKVLVRIVSRLNLSRMISHDEFHERLYFNLDKLKFPLKMNSSILSKLNPEGRKDDPFMMMYT